MSNLFTALITPIDAVKQDGQCEIGSRILVSLLSSKTFHHIIEMPICKEPEKLAYLVS